MTDTRTTTLPAGDDGSPASPAASPSGAAVPVALPSPRHRWWAVPLTVVAVLALFAIAILGVVPSELAASKQNERLDTAQGAAYARTPGSAQPVNDRITFGDLGQVADQYPADGDVYFVTVTEPSQSVLSWLLGRDEPAVQFLTEEEKFGIQTPQQRRTFALESMRTSEQVAQYVALERVGYDVGLVRGEVLIERMVCLEPNEEGTDCATWSPSDEVLDPGDRILEVDGRSVDTVDDLGAILTEFSPGDVVTMRIERPGDGELEVEVELTSSPEDAERTIVGFYPFDTTRVDLPFELDIDTGSIGGPSAGLAFTLTLIDELTEGELTGGVRVAVTGEIRLDGTVGPIGGLRQKASAVEQAGVEVFLVPAAQSEADIEAARLAGGDGLEIIPVETLDEALEVLERLGGDPIPPPPAAP